MNKISHWALQKWCERNSIMFPPDEGEYDVNVTIHIKGRVRVGKPYDGIYGLKNGVTKLDITIEEINGD